MKVEKGNREEVRKRCSYFLLTNLGLCLGGQAFQLLRRLMKHYNDRKRVLHTVFINLEKTYDRVCREVLWSSLVIKGTLMAYIRVIRDKYM